MFGRARAFECNAKASEFMDLGFMSVWGSGAKCLRTPYSGFFIQSPTQDFDV